MAGGLIASPHTKTTFHLILTSICRTGLLSEYPIHPIRLRFYPLLRLQFTFRPSSRYLYSCTKDQQHGPIDLSKYRETFSKRMALAGLKPHHRLALGVSGGPDSMALCVLAAMWKREGQCGIEVIDSSGFIDGLMAIVVDHGLRRESKEEANLVCSRVTKMGIRCEIALCEWSEGRPKQGHLQEAAREKRYQILQEVCIRHQIGVLMIAHHADDQAELFILRLSRGSGVLGLSGMASVSQLFPMFPDYSREALNWHGLLLVRPLLEFSKEDMFQICKGGNQEWVEDPTNQSPVFARNRIRMSLNNLSSSIFKAELQAIISACREMRLHVDKICSNLINQAVTIMPEGYAVINLKILNASSIKDIYLSKFLALVLQFISQRHRPVRGSASKLLLDYIRTFPSRTCLTAAGCYLSPVPGSKGSKVLICCSLNSNVPVKLEIIQAHANGKQNSISSEVEQIVRNAMACLDKFICGVSDVRLFSLTSPHIVDLKSSESVLIEAKRLGILSNSTYDTIFSLQNHEKQHFMSKTEVMSDRDMTNGRKPEDTIASRRIYPGQIGYFMSRFLIKWNPCREMPYKLFSSSETRYDKVLELERQQSCSSCLVHHEHVAEIRCMVDSDWLYLANLSKSQNMGNSLEQVLSAAAIKQEAGKIKTWSDFVKLSAQRALMSLKSIPVNARRSLPVLVDSQGLLLSIPNVGFRHCPCLDVCAIFKPRVPVGGGHTSFL
ncbi:uncharacterized protein [Coffea arabica]|uniref:tRNA(Ile)-lysidine synthetase n=1 Tax=Coffea arabica TaxID=13443 RepID=A0A6P6SQE3_COFAR|nr:uncharacterized protein LOC113693705 isoform X1 [Coffea arabica]